MGIPLKSASLHYMGRSRLDAEAGVDDAHEADTRTGHRPPVRRIEQRGVR